MILVRVRENVKPGPEPILRSSPDRCFVPEAMVDYCLFDASASEAGSGSIVNGVSGPNPSYEYCVIAMLEAVPGGAPLCISPVPNRLFGNKKVRSTGRLGDCNFTSGLRPCSQDALCKKFKGAKEAVGAGFLSR